MSAIGEFGAVRPDQEQPKTGSLKKPQAEQTTNITTQEQAQLAKLAKIKNIILSELAAVVKENVLPIKDVAIMFGLSKSAPEKKEAIAEESSEAQQGTKEEKVQTFKKSELSRTAQSALHSRARMRVNQMLAAKQSSAAISTLFAVHGLQAVREQDGIAQLKDDANGAIIEGVLSARGVVKIAKAWRVEFP